MGETPFAITVQAIGTLMVAALLWQLTRLIPGRFLRYWCFAWVCLTAALFALRMTKAQHLPESLKPLGYTGYLLGEFLFGFLLWAGFRDYAAECPLARRDAAIVAALIPLAAIAPWWLPENWLLALHTAVMTLFFFASFLASLQIRPRIPRPPVGLNIVRIMLFGLAVIFLLFTPLLVWAKFAESMEGQFLRLSLIDYALIEIGLAFGLVVLAAERAQDALEEKNRLLAETSRRDALTGLYNRRHFDELLAAHKDQPSFGALAVIDVNDLKRLNDQHLHSTGDAVLQIVARALVSKFRVTDPVFRIGGDEFVALMFNGNEADLAARMADIDDALGNLRVPGIAEPTDVRVAWGLASFLHGDELPRALVAADQAMYACKARRKTIVTEL